MKFTEKYELLETLTTGAVETFVANDKVRGERVLVHIVECTPQKPDQTPAEWVLESFRKLAPEPPGPVLETGKYSGPKYGYVVVRVADETAAKAWARRYELQADETKETKRHVVKTDLSTPPVLPPVALGSSAQAPGSMTQLFRDYDSLEKSKPTDSPSPANMPPVKPVPSTGLPGGSGLHAATPWDPASAKVPASLKPGPLSAPPASPRHISPELPQSAARETARPGEFTNFFQGPFQGDKAAEMPAFSSQPIDPPKKTVGEFTALFGRSNSSVAATPAPASPSESSFTSIFKDMASPQPTFNAPGPVQGGVIPPPAQPLPVVHPANVASLPDPVFVAPTPTPVVTPIPSEPALPPSPLVPAAKLAVPQRSASLHGDGATGAFMHPAAEPAPVQAEAPSGPSPYTQIISRPKLSEPEEAEAAYAPAAGGGAGKFGSPSMPKIPAAAPPPIPRIPPPPKVTPPPPAPKMKAPPAPKAPTVDTPAPPPVSMWPLIITLTILFFLAVILVLYFALRH